MDRKTLTLIVILITLTSAAWMAAPIANLFNPSPLKEELNIFQSDVYQLAIAWEEFRLDQKAQGKPQAFPASLDDLVIGGYLSSSEVSRLQTGRTISMHAPPKDALTGFAVITLSDWRLEKEARITTSGGVKIGPINMEPEPLHSSPSR